MTVSPTASPSSQPVDGQCGSLRLPLTMSFGEAIVLRIVLRAGPPPGKTAL